METRKSKILGATKVLSDGFYSKALELGDSNKITSYEQKVLVWAILIAGVFIENLLDRQGYPLFQIPDNQLGGEGCARKAYYKMVIFLLYVHGQRAVNNKEIRQIADTPIEKIAETLNGLLSLKKDYVKDYMKILKDVQIKDDENLLEVNIYQMTETTKDLLAIEEDAQDIFSDFKIKKFLPMAINIQSVESAKAMDKILGIPANT